MNLRQYIAIMFFATTLCWVSLFFVMVNVDPFASNVVGHVFFYVSLFLALVGTLSLIMLGAHKKYSQTELSIHRYVKRTFRMSLLGAGFLTMLLVMKGTQTLHLWNLTIFIIVISLIISLHISKTT